MKILIQDIITLWTDHGNKTISFQANGGFVHQQTESRQPCELLITKKLYIHYYSSDEVYGWCRQPRCSISYKLFRPGEYGIFSNRMVTVLSIFGGNTKRQGRIHKLLLNFNLS